MRSIISQLPIYLHTLRRLRPMQMYGQLAYRLRPGRCALRVQPSLLASSVTGLYLSELDSSPQFLDRFDVSGMLRGQLTLLHQQTDIPWGVWHCEGFSPLFNYNLHYFEYLLPLSVQYKQTGEQVCLALVRRLVDDWTQTCIAPVLADPVRRIPPTLSDAWAAYTISLRAVNWMVCLELIGDGLPETTRNSMARTLALQIAHLKANLETRTLANHYFENLKTIAIFALLQGDVTSIMRFLPKLLAEVSEQILPDGRHYERSPMYHKIILEGLLRLASVLKITKHPALVEVLPHIQRMVSALWFMEGQRHTTPLFNDAGDNVAKPAPALLEAARAHFGIIPDEAEQTAGPGYYKLTDWGGRLSLLMDIDDMGPAYQLGHAHCDCLSFELALDGTALFVNCGTGLYQGNLRGYFRSTQAHNTAMLGAMQQAQCWGEHRVARCYTSLSAVRDGRTLVGSYKTWQGARHTRQLSLKDAVLQVRDRFDWPQDAVITSYLRVAPGFEVVPVGGQGYHVLAQGQVICEVQPMSCTATLYREGALCACAPEFGLMQQAPTLVFQWNCSLGEGGYQVRFKES